MRMPDWRKHNPGVENMNVAVMGCVVNGPGESRHANIGISLPGSGEAPVSPVFIDGKKWGSLKGPKMSEEFIRSSKSTFRKITKMLRNNNGD